MLDKDIWAAEFKVILTESIELQDTKTEEWHHSKPEAECPEMSADFINLSRIIVQQHLHNFTLWHIEDSARRVDVGDDVIAKCKREIDQENQKRNDAIELLDECLVKLMQPYLPTPKEKILNTETLGMAIDRLSILSLKVYHMREQVERDDVDDEHRKSCKEKLEVLKMQRKNLSRAVFSLIYEYLAGSKVPKVYYQFKMYNDPKLNPELYKN